MVQSYHMAVDNTTKTISEKLLIIFSIFIIGTVSAIISLKVNNKVHNSSYIQEGKIEKRETYTICFSEFFTVSISAISLL